MPSEDDLTRKELISLLKRKRGVLMVGAGSSKLAGFPLWDEFIEEMRSSLTPSISKREDIPPTVYADLIKDALVKEGRSLEYFKFLERRFQPNRGRDHTPFHCALVQLGFSGIITTNYEIVLETAVGEASSQGQYKLCEAIDLCDRKSYRVFDFLRSLSPVDEHRSVLHLHGCYHNSESIILTHKDYLRAYGELGDRPDVPLDTLHRKVIWALMTMHSLVFVGFSMRDEFFMRMLEVVQRDFQLDTEPAHFAIMDYSADAEKEKTSTILRLKGIWPIFYQVLPSEQSGGARDHSGLERLILELADTLGTPTGSPTSAEITKRMLER